MSIRSAVCKSLRDELIAVLDGNNPNYITNMYSNITNRVVHLANVPDYPYMSVTPGPERREDQPSNFTWGFLTVNIRIYVSNEDDAQGELETIISDVEAFLDENINVAFTVTRPSGDVDGETTDITIESIQTDEGILDPKGLAEIVVTVRYEKYRTHS